MQRPNWAPVAALVFNAFVWGVSWWPFRQLHEHGLHPLWSTALIYALSIVAITVARPGAWRELFGTPALWLVAAAAGSTNAAFNWGVAIGDVVRVVLLFYLMPRGAVLRARGLLGEPLRWSAAARVALAVIGAMVVLRPEDGGWPWPDRLADWLGILGGFTFALNNVMLRREAAASSGARGLAMFIGGAGVSALVATALHGQGVPFPPAPAAAWIAMGAGLAVCFLAGNLALQYGATRLPANVSAVVMLTEVLFASASALWLGGGTLSLSMLIGGALIVAAAVLAALSP